MPRLCCLQTYVNNINAQVDKFPELKDLGLVAMNQSIGSPKIPKEAATAVRYCTLWPAAYSAGIMHLNSAASDAVCQIMQEQRRWTLESLFLLEGTVLPVRCCYQLFSNERSWLNRR